MGTLILQSETPFFLQLCAPFVRLARQPLLIDMLRVTHHHAYQYAKLRGNFLMRESIKTPVADGHSAPPVGL
jgi:hypothetical protein